MHHKEPRDPPPPQALQHPRLSLQPVPAATAMGGQGRPTRGRSAEGGTRRGGDVRPGRGSRSARSGCGAGRWRRWRRPPRLQPGRRVAGAACGGAANGYSTGCPCSSSPASSAGPTTPMSPSFACVSVAGQGGKGKRGRQGAARDGRVGGRGRCLLFVRSAATPEVGAAARAGGTSAVSSPLSLHSCVQE